MLAAVPVPTCMVKLLPVSAVAVTFVPLPLATWPIWSARTPCAKLTEMVLPTLAPTWNVVTPLLPSSTLVPLNEVCDAIRVISAICCCTWASSAARSAALFEPFADSTASVRMLCKASVKVDNAPPAVCASETASLALLTAWLVPLICVVNC